MEEDREKRGLKEGREWRKMLEEMHSFRRTLVKTRRMLPVRDHGKKKKKYMEVMKKYMEKKLQKIK